MTLPLELDLHPMLPLRTPRRGRDRLVSGYDLRLPDGPRLAPDDQLLAAFGAAVQVLLGAGEDDEGLQHPNFAPGHRVRLLADGFDDDGDPVVAVWDDEELRRAGHLPYLCAAAVTAAREHGLHPEAVVLREERTLLDDRRCDLRLLVHSRELVAVRTEDRPRVPRPSRPARRRLVLLADGKSPLRFWDPSGRDGPLELEELPLSRELAAELRELAEAYAQLVPTDDAFEQAFARSNLHARTRELWRRARSELGRRYAIGLLAPGMTRPSFSPGEEDSGAADDDIPF